MQFTSLVFLILFPLVLIIYYSIPLKLRNSFLLLASCIFYLTFGVMYFPVLCAVTAVAYISGRVLEKDISEFKRKLCVAVCVTANFVILLFFKYINMALTTLSGIQHLFGMQQSVLELKIVVPVGISFFTFAAVSYTIDVYRRAVNVQHNFAKFALFVAFFPFIVSGPIQKSKDFLPQLDEPHAFDYRRVKKGIMLMGFGFFQKLVIADRAGIVVDNVFASPGKYSGSILVFATLLFVAQLYADFAGYSNIAVGIAEALGFSIRKNFNHPYFSKSIAEFWRRWHIALSSWFKEYLYFPLGGNRRGKLKKMRNVMIVFLLSGLWHGTSWNFVIWGFLHGFYHITGALLLPLRNKIVNLLHFDRNSYFGRTVRIGITFSLVSFAWIFFRANTIADSFIIVKRIFTCFRSASPFYETALGLGLNLRSLILLFISVAILFTISLLGRERDLRDVICEKNIAIRWTIYIVFTLMILIFGLYGAGFNQQSFIYAQF